jgi:lysophospholipase L1-like esterase
VKSQIRFAAFVLLAVLVAVPSFAQRGSANFSQFVDLGDSYGAGFASNSLNARHQEWSWPAIIARQVGLTLCAPGAAANAGCFAQPLVSYPGIGPELQLMNLQGTILPAAGMGQPMMLNFARPYNNLSIPGATVGALLTLTGAEPQQPGEPTAVSMGRFILRGLGTPVQQATALHPTFIALWIGGNDYLNVAFSGNPATITPVDAFKARYEALLDQLIAGSPNAGMVVGNLPVAAIPYLTLVPPVLVDPVTRQPILINGQMVFYIAKDEQGNVAPIAPTTLIPLQTREKIAMGYGLPPQLAAIPPFNQLPHVGKPLEANDVITAAEFAQVATIVAGYNQAIQQAAAARNIPVADIAGLFNRIAAPGGLHLGPVTVSNAFVTGGFYSLDGFHLTDLGYLLFANEYIKAINAAYETAIPLASITQLFANNGANFDEGFGGGAEMSGAAVNAIKSFWVGQEPAEVETPAEPTGRRRASGRR